MRVYALKGLCRFHLCRLPLGQRQFLRLRFGLRLLGNTARRAGVVWVGGGIHGYSAAKWNQSYRQAARQRQTPTDVVPVDCIGQYQPHASGACYKSVIEGDVRDFVGLVVGIRRFRLRGGRPQL